MSHNLSNRAMLARVSISVYTGRVLDRRASSDVTAQANAHHGAADVHKHLLDKRLLLPIQQAAARARAEHYRYTMPWQDDAYRILPSPVWHEHDQAVRRECDSLLVAARTLVLDYQDRNIPELARERLGALWRAEDYPSPAGLLARFNACVYYRPMPDAADWRIDIGDEMRDAYKEECNSAHKAVLRELFGRLHDATARIAAALRRADAGGRLHESLWEGAREIALMMPQLNVTNDPILEQAAQDILKQLVPGAPEAERDKMRNASPAVRIAKAAEAEALAARMAAVMGSL